MPSYATLCNSDVVELLWAAFLELISGVSMAMNFLITFVYYNSIFGQMDNYLQDAQSHKLQTKHQ